VLHGEATGRYLLNLQHSYIQQPLDLSSAEN